MRTLARSLTAIVLFATGSMAADAPYLTVYGGDFDISQKDNQAAMGGIEYRFRDQFNGLRPVVGLMGTTDEAGYAYAGAYWDLPLNTAPFVITPGFQAGAFTHGDGKDLGYGLQFRSTIEAAYEFEGGQRLGVGFSHLSNASLGNHNPGAETLQLVYSHPM